MVDTKEKGRNHMSNVKCWSCGRIGHCWRDCKERRPSRDSAEHYLRDEQVEARDASINEVGALLTEECCSDGPRRCKEQRVRRQRPREETTLVRTREEGARARGRVRGRTAIRPEQTKQRVMVPPEVPHDTRIFVEDLVDIDESDVDRLRDYEKKVKQPGAGTQEPVKKTARDWDPRTREQKSSANSRHEADVQREELAKLQEQM